VKSAIFTFVRPSKKSVVASVKMTHWLSELLNLEVHYNESVPNDLDCLVIVGGAYGFAGTDILAHLGTAIETAKRILWIQNDYTVVPPKDRSGAESPFRKAFRNRYNCGMPHVDYWTTCENYANPGEARTGHLCGRMSRYVNWNCLAFDETQPLVRMDDRSRQDTLIYYGSHRENRVDTFARYLANPSCPTMISSPSKKFRELHTHPMIEHCGAFPDIVPMLSQFGLGLYLEDLKSHAEYHSPANRFYEMLCAGLPVVFQPECRRTFDKYGIDICDYEVWNSVDIRVAMNHRVKIQAQQRDRWWGKALIDRQKLETGVKALWKEYWL
jgi:hypothetical protein